MYDELHYWLILANNLTEALDVIDDSAFGLSTDFVIAIPSSVKEFLLYDVYNLNKDKGTDLNVTVLGTWNVTDGLTFIMEDKKWIRRSELHGLELKIAFYSVNNLF